jgi:GDP-4-dehydro-6-deoxy-D-mannose reductase
MMKKILITGAAGFFGRNMFSYLHNLKEGLLLICTDIHKPRDISEKNFVILDLSQKKPVEDYIKKNSPDIIIHFAGIFGDREYDEQYTGNVISTAVLLEAIRKYTPNSVVICIGSAAEYGAITSSQLPIDEKTLCKPVSSYGLTKNLATQIALYHQRVNHMCIMVVRPFQLIGKGIPNHLAPGSFAEQLNEIIKKNSRQTLKVGNLESSRDFLDIHDAVEAIWCLCNKPASGEIFNLCSGKPTKMADLLKTMINHCHTNVRIEVDPSRLKSNTDVSIVYGSNQKLMNYCQWHPKRTLDQSIQSMFE